MHPALISRGSGSEGRSGKKYYKERYGGDFAAALDRIAGTNDAEAKQVAVDDALRIVLKRDKSQHPILMRQMKAKDKLLLLPALQERLQQLATAEMKIMPVGRFFRPKPYVDRLRSEHHAFWRNGNFHCWNDEDLWYCRWDVKAIRREIIRWIGDEARARHLDEIIRLGESELEASDDMMAPPELVAIEGGILNCNTLTLIQPSPEYRIPTKLSVRFNPDAKSAAYDAFCNHAFPEHGQQALWEEMVGYTLLRDARMQVAFLLLDEDIGATGKTTACEIVGRMLGPDNYTTLSLADMGHRFRLAQLVNRHANFSNEVHTRNFVEATDVLKALVSGDEQTFERKYENPFQAKVFSKFFVTANRYPKVSEGDPYFRRWIILKFVNPFPKPGEGGNVPNFAASLSTHDMEAVLFRALVGLNRLLKEKRFTIPESSRVTMTNYRRSMNPLLEFADECLEVTDSSVGDIQAKIYKCYSDWCKETNHKPLAKSEGWRQDLARVVGKSWQKGRSRYMFLPGISVTRDQV